AVVSSSRIWSRTTCDTGRVECQSILVQYWIQWNDAGRRTVIPVERGDPVVSHEPVDNSNLAETDGDGPTIGTDALLEVGASSRRRYRGTEAGGYNTEGKKVMTYIPRLRPDPERQVPVAPEVGAANTRSGGEPFPKPRQSVASSNRRTISSRGGATCTATRACYWTAFPRARSYQSMVCDWIVGGSGTGDVNVHVGGWEGTV